MPDEHAANMQSAALHMNGPHERSTWPKCATYMYNRMGRPIAKVVDECSRVTMHNTSSTSFDSMAPVQGRAVDAAT